MKTMIQFHYKPTRMAKVEIMTPTTGKDMGQLEISYLLKRIEKI